MRRAATIAALVIVALVVVAHSNVEVASSYYEGDSLLVGPYIDEVIFRFIPSSDDRILALQAGDIEMDYSLFDPIYFDIIQMDPDLSVHYSARNGYGQILINCDKYPLNISGLRRAFAFAFNKSKVTSEYLDGFGIEHDSLVPQPNGWCIEDQFDWHYYDARQDIGNQILDDLGFAINATSGFRHAPDGSPFEVVIEYSLPGSSYGPYDVAVEALHSLHIDARKQGSEFNEMVNRLTSHDDYDMIFYPFSFYDTDVVWLAYFYWSEYADVPYQNPSNFRNDTFDSWRDQLIYNTSYTDVYEAASEMQKILHYNVPSLVVSVNVYMQCYRNDQYAGHVDDLREFKVCPWNLRNIYKIDSTPGGSVPVGISWTFETFNIFLAYSNYDKALFDNLWPSLYKYGQDLTPWPDLAENLLIETHSDNTAVPDGHTRFTVDIIQNATWSDGTPLTAEDVAFSIIYAYESTRYGNPAGIYLGDFVGAYAPTPYRAVIEFSTESYWHFSSFAFAYIIPYHIFNDVDGIGYDGWNTWNPEYDPSDPHVNCGPFTFVEFENDISYTIQRNPLFHYAAITDPVTEPTSTITITGIPTPTTSTTSTTASTTSGTVTTSGTNQLPGPQVNLSLAVSSIIGSISSVVIIYCVFHIVKKQQTMDDI